jgi:type I restriction enzyme, S subunit
MSSEWTLQKISALGDFDRGKSKHRPRDAAHLYGGPYPFIQTGDITNAHGRISTYKQTYSEAGLAQSKLWPAGTLAITIAANIAETALLTFPACFPDSVVGFTANQKKTDVRFIQYLFQAFRKNVKSRAYGSAQENINLEVLRGLEFPIPPLEIQVEIANFLSLLDDRITLLRETNTTLEAIAQALFKSWFVDFDPVRAKQEGRAPEGMHEATAAMFPDSFEESELGFVPKGWRVGVLGDFLSLRNERTRPSDLTASLPYVPVESISSKSPFLQECKSGDEANSSLILFHKGDVLFGAMRPYFHKVCSAPFDGVTRTTVFTLVPKNTMAAAFSLFQAYQDAIIEYATQHSEGSTIPYAKWGNSLEKMPVLVPPNELQERFSEVVSSFIDSGNENIRKIQTLGSLLDTLLPRLISGQLRLPETEELVNA